MTESCPIKDPVQVSVIIREVVEAVVLPRWKNLKKEEIREKGPDNLVTVADTDCEALLGRRLRDLVPGSVVVGEEAVAEAPGLLDRLAQATPVWIIDPVDGTGNFARGNPDFTVLVALAVAGRVCGGWVHHPVDNRTISAIAGSGAWVDGVPVRLAGGACHTPLNGAAYGRTANGALARKVLRGARIGTIDNSCCGGIEYLRLVSGSADFFYSTGCLPWDHAAGVLVVTEAGGFCRRLDDRPYTLTTPAGTPLLAARSEAVWAAVATLLD